MPPGRDATPRCDPRPPGRPGQPVPVGPIGGRGPRCPVVITRAGDGCEPGESARAALAVLAVLAALAVLAVLAGFVGEPHAIPLAGAIRTVDGRPELSTRRPCVGTCGRHDAIGTRRSETARDTVKAAVDKPEATGNAAAAERWSRTATRVRCRCTVWPPSPEPHCGEARRDGGEGKAAGGGGEAAGGEVEAIGAGANGSARAGRTGDVAVRFGIEVTGATGCGAAAARAAGCGAGVGRAAGCGVGAGRAAGCGGGAARAAGRGAGAGRAAGCGAGAGRGWGRTGSAGRTPPSPPAPGAQKPSRRARSAASRRVCIRNLPQSRRTWCSRRNCSRSGHQRRDRVRSRIPATCARLNNPSCPMPKIVLPPTPPCRIEKTIRHRSNHGH